VLVCTGENKRVRIPAAAEADALTEAIRDSFKDIVQPGQEFFLQLKSEEWGFVLLDMVGHMAHRNKNTGL